MPDTPADELRTAASRLRDLANAASTGRSGEPTTRWAFTELRHDDGRGWGSGMLRSIDHLNQGDDPRLGKALIHGNSGPRGRAPSLAVQHGTYIATMHPGVGKALADWLDQEAHAYDCAVYAANEVFAGDPAGHDNFLTTTGAPSPHALRIAHTINQEQT